MCKTSSCYFPSVSNVLFIVLLACFLGCEEPKSTATDIRKGELWASIHDLLQRGNHTAATKALKRSNVRADVDEMIAEGDTRWTGVYELTLLLPGLDNEFVSSVPKDRIWIIPGTSDVYASKEEKEWQLAATEYASQYNRILKERLDGREGGAITHDAHRRSPSGDEGHGSFREILWFAAAVRG